MNIAKINQFPFTTNVILPIGVFSVTREFKVEIREYIEDNRFATYHEEETYAEYHSNTHVYLDIATLYTNRPHLGESNSELVKTHHAIAELEYKIVTTCVLRSIKKLDLRLDPLEMRWSNYAGCDCGCSPGILIKPIANKLLNSWDIYIDDVVNLEEN